MTSPDFLSNRRNAPLRPPGAINRRQLLQASTLTAAALGLGAAHRRGLAQGLSGAIRIGYDSSNEQAIPFIEATVSALLDANPDASIELEPSPGGSYLTQIVLQLAGGQAPDVFLLAGAALAELAAGKFVAPLDDFAAGWDGWSQYPDHLRTQSVFDGQIWAIPYAYDTHFVYYRRDIFAQAGLPTEWMPATTDDILAAALTIKENVPGVIPYALYAGANGGLSTVGRGFVPLVYADGGELKDENGKWLIDSCAIRFALGYYERAYQIDQTVPQDVMTGSSPETALPDAMFNGELGIFLEGSWNYGDWLRLDPDMTREQIGYVLHPGTGDRAPFSLGFSGASWYVNSRSENQELAWAFIAGFNSRETQVALNVADPHIPGRLDAAADPAFLDDPFLNAMVASTDALVLADPDPAFRQLITIVQNATGVIATGEATPDEALERYTSELTRVLGEENVASQECVEGA